MKTCYELTGSLNGIEVDTELLFPNVQTCVAIVAVSGGQLVGAHATVSDRGRMLQIADRLLKSSGGSPTVYVVGPVSGYNLGPLTNIGRVYFCETEAYIDVRASIDGGTLTFGKRATGTGGNFEDIPLDRFS